MAKVAFGNSFNNKTCSSRRIQPLEPVPFFFHTKIITDCSCSLQASLLGLSSASATPESARLTSGYSIETISDFVAAVLIVADVLARLVILQRQFERWNCFVHVHHDVVFGLERPFVWRGRICAGQRRQIDERKVKRIADDRIGGGE
jgi:hypothetical protein